MRFFDRIRADSPRGAPKPRRLRVEFLETRSLLSVSPVVAGDGQDTSNDMVLELTSNFADYRSDPLASVLDTSVVRLFREYESWTGPGDFEPSNLAWAVKGQSLNIIITGSRNLDGVEEQLREQFGLQIRRVISHRTIATATVPFELLDDLAQIEGIRNIGGISYPLHKDPPALSELATAAAEASLESSDSDVGGWFDSLTPEQAQVREDLLGMMSNDRAYRGKWGSFEPLRMPEEFLDELYETFGVKGTWDSLWRWMDDLFGPEVIQNRSDTPGYFTIDEFVSTPEQFRVRDELHAILSRGGSMDELENFEPVPMPESFLDELYDTYGVDRIWDSLGGKTLTDLFGSHILLNRGDTRFTIDPIELGPTPDYEVVQYDAKEFAGNDIPDYFELARSGDELILTISEDTAPFDGRDLVVRSTTTLDARKDIYISLRSSSDVDVYRIKDLGDFQGEVNIEGVKAESVTDQVQIYDTPGDDVWIAREDFGSFQMENAYSVNAHSAGALHGYAKAGGNDRAYLHGNDQANRLKTDSQLVRLYQGDVYFRAKFFDSVEIDGNGGEDTAILQGTRGNDEFRVSRDEGSFQSGDGVEYLYHDFESVIAHGYSGNDRGYYSDSAAAEEVRVRPSKIVVRDRAASMPYLILRGIDYFYAEALTDDGNVDIVKMHDRDASANSPMTSDLLTAGMDGSHVRARFYRGSTNVPDPTTADLIYESLGFEITKGYSDSGNDRRAADEVEPALLAWEGIWEDA